MKKLREKSKNINPKGITLISLVVTIVVLLILAGVSIYTLTGENGLISKAQDAKEKTEQSTVSENLALQDHDNYINQYIETSEHSEFVHNEAIYKIATYNNETSEYTYKELNSGEKFPETVSNGDIYIYTDYEYRYNCFYDYNNNTWTLDTEQNGWGVNVLDRNKTTYSKILLKINNISITNLNSTFRMCGQLTFAPDIPESTTDISNIFRGCNKLITAPNIPDNVENMQYAFGWCSSLENVPYIGSSIKDMSYAFTNCKKLTIVPDLPDGITNLKSTFEKCISLTSVGNLPDSITDMSNTFYGCSLLTTITNLPTDVSKLSQTFKYCSSLMNCPSIPSGVTDLYYTFQDCTTLTGNIEINANPSRYDGCFSNVDFTAQKLTLTGDSNLLDKLGATGKNY